MNRAWQAAVILLAACIPAMASAQPSVNVNFQPGAICPGRTVAFSLGLKNEGNAARMVTLDFTLSINGHDIGPIERHALLGPGQQISKSVPFLVPTSAPAGPFGVSVQATDKDGSVMGSATLLIQQCGSTTTASNEDDLVRAFTRMLGDLVRP